MPTPNTPSFVDGFVQRQMSDAIGIKTRLFEDRASMDALKAICGAVIQAYKSGKKTLIAGNGGSAADAQHMAGEFVSRFYFDRPALPSVALNTDTSIVTAIGNDYGYDQIFSRQVEAHGQPGDVFIGLSTSGKSPNILKAVAAAKAKGMITVGLTGQKGDALAHAVDFCIRVPSSETPRIQECHTLLAHIICAAVEEALFGKA